MLNNHYFLPFWSCENYSFSCLGMCFEYFQFEHLVRLQITNPSIDCKQERITYMSCIINAMWFGGLCKSTKSLSKV